MLSFKVCDAIIEIDRKTGDIVSILGGKKDMFGLTAEQKFMGQHSVSIGINGDLIVFNNGIVNENRAESETNIMRFTLDTENKKVLAFKKYDLKNKYCFGMGDAKEIQKDVFLVSWGKTVPPLSLFSEIDFNVDLTTFEVLYNSRNYNYATFKYDK